MKILFQLILILVLYEFSTNARYMTNLKSFKPGFCPISSPGENGWCVFMCSSDAGCSGDLKCCSTGGCGGTICQKPVLDKNIKPGYCPLPEPGSISLCAFLCSSDKNCVDDLKCCANACGGTQCLKPL